MLTIIKNLYDYHKLMATQASNNIALGKRKMLPIPICPLR